MLELDTLLDIFPTPKTSFMASILSFDIAVLFTIVVFDVVVVVPVLYTLYPCAFSSFVACVNNALFPLPFNNSIFIFDVSFVSVLSDVLFHFLVHLFLHFLLFHFVQ